MKRTLFTLVMAGVFLAAMAVSGLAATENEAPSAGDTQPATTSSMPGMMGKGRAGMGTMPCMIHPQAAKPKMMAKGMGTMMKSRMSDMMGMMGPGKTDMMEQRSAHMFYLDRAKELGLSPEQVSKLKALQLDCLKDNIRNAAELKIAHLELSALLGNDNWTVKEAEPLVRKMEQLKGDMQLRHLQAVSDANKVLTTEQLKQVQTDDNTDNLEDLFQ